MDPQQTLTDLLEAMRAKEWDEAKNLAEALHQWLVNRGFPPTTIGDPSLGTEWHRAIATFVCMAAISKVKDIHARRAKKLQREKA